MLASLHPLFTLGLLILLVQACNSKEYTRIVQLRQGRLRGVVRSPVHNGNLNNIHMYLGIPYAAPPVGQLRFMAPQSPQPWPGLMTADSFSPVCPQRLPNLDDESSGKKMSAGRLQYLRSLVPFLKNQSEDCLYLNIYTPLPDSARSYRRHSVLVIIHGESYSFGSGSIYDGFVLASYANLIVVTFNFRLGILGFLRPGVGTGTITNFGIMDQVAALQWIKDNIEHFGGDPTSVTLMGHGTGAASINFLMLSPLLSPNYDLFKRAILMSGSALSLWSMVTHPMQYTLQVAQHFNCPDTDPEMSTCLRNKRLSDITAMEIEGPRFQTAFGPIVDGHVIPNDPEQCMTVYRDIFSRYELMFGLTQMESYHLLDGISLLYGMKYEQSEALLREFVYSKYEAHPDVALGKILREYNSWNRSSSGGSGSKSEAETNRDLVLSILSDGLYDAPLLRVGEYHAQANKETYFYVFDQGSANVLFPYTDKSVSGEEVPYFLGIPLDGDLYQYKNKYTPQEKLHSEVILTWVSNFARTGNPNLGMKQRFLFLSDQEWSPYLQLDWPPFDAHNQSYLLLDIPPKINKHYKREKMRYWNVNLPRALSQSLLPNKPPDKYPSRHPSILREFPPAPEPDRDYSEPKYPNPEQSNPDVTRSRHFDTRPWIEPPRPRSEEEREDFNPYDNFGTRPQVAHPSDETETTEIEPVVKNSSMSTILIVIGVLFLLINLFAFAIIFYQKSRLSVREHLFNNARMRHLQCTSRNPCDGDADEYEFTDEEVESQIYMKKAAAAAVPTDVKSILKNTNSDYEAVSNNKQFAERKNSTSTLDTNMKVRQWIVEKCNGETQFEPDGSSEEIGGKMVVSGTSSTQSKHRGEGKLKENIYVERKGKESDYDVIKTRRKISNGSSSTKKQPVKKVSVAVDATPATRTASVLRQIPIEITKSSKSLNEISKDECEIPLVLRKNKSFDYPEDEYVDEKSRTLPSSFNKKRSMSTNSIHELKQLIDSNKSFQEITMLKDKTKTLKQKPKKNVHTNEANILDDSSRHVSKSNIKGQDVNVTSRDENLTVLPLTHQQMLNGIKRRNFPKVLPEYPQNNEGLISSLPSISSDVRRLSLPPNSFDLCLNQGGGGSISKIPPLPPPRISSTLGRKSQQPLHKSQVFIQLNKNEHVIPETIDESFSESVLTKSENETDIEKAIDNILKSQPKLTKQDSIDIESNTDQMKNNLETLKQTKKNKIVEQPSPSVENKDRNSSLSEKSRSSNSFESAIRKQKNKILNKLNGSSSSSSEGPQKKHQKSDENRNIELKIKDKSPECINLSEENVFYETVFHDSSVSNVVPNSNIEKSTTVNKINDEIPFVHKQQNKTPEEIYKTLKMIRLEKEQLLNSNPQLLSPSLQNSSNISTPSLPINDKTSTYAIIRNTNQNPQQLSSTQQKSTKLVSKEPKYIIKPQLSQITSSASHLSKKIPHAVVPSTNIVRTIPDVPTTERRVASSNKTLIPGVQSNIMIGTQPNIITGSRSASKPISNKESIESISKVPNHTTNTQGSTHTIVEKSTCDLNVNTDEAKNASLKSMSNIHVCNSSSINKPSSSKNVLPNTAPSFPNSTTHAPPATYSSSNVPNNPNSNVLQTKLAQEKNVQVMDSNNDVTRTNSNSSKISTNKKSTSTETLSSDKTCSSTQSSKSNNATVDGMSTIKRKKKS